MIFGGRLAVLVRIVEVLNELGIEPDFVSIRIPFDPATLEQRYGLRLRFRVRELPAPCKIWRHELGVATFGALLRAAGLQRRYDLLIDSNNTSFLMPAMPIVSYVHFPRKARLDSPLVSIHAPEGPRKRWTSPLGAYYKLVQQLYRFDAPRPDQLLIANSEFTRQSFLEAYPESVVDMPVLYPPVLPPDTAIAPLAERRQAVISLGRFCAAKQQFEQVQVARQLPDWEFHLVGFVDAKEQPYVEKCRRYVADHGLRNVTFHVGIPEAEKLALLQQCRIFLHTNIQEPFGITTVEGILAGCVPVVHDSGGQREVVPYPELRFRHLDDIPAILTRCADLDLESIRAALIQQCRDSYSVERFKTEFRRLFVDYLEQQSHLLGA